MLSMMIHMYIDQAYKGGAEAFSKDFHTFMSQSGEFFVTPIEAGRELSAGFKSGLEEMAAGIYFHGRKSDPNLSADMG